VKKILGVCSVGSLKKEIQPGSIVVPEDYVNLNPVPTFYNDTIKHTVPGMSTELQKALGYPKGVYLQATGPRYETKAEIKFYSTIADVIGMTMASEATLSKELGLEYACVCSVDNYANGIGEQLVDEMIGLNARKNSEKILEILKKTVKELE